MRFMRGSRDYCQAVQVQLPENSSDNVVFLFFFSPKLILQRMSNGYSKRKLLFSKVSEGVQLFQWGGGATFSRGGGGGPNAHFYRNP